MFGQSPAALHIEGEEEKKMLTAEYNILGMAIDDRLHGLPSKGQVT
jgi:hypothetical protein